MGGDSILTYNLSNGSFDHPIKKFSTRLSCSSLQGHNLKLHHRHFRLNRKKVAFTLEQVARFRRWIGISRRYQIKTGRVLDGSVCERYLATQSVPNPYCMAVKWLYCYDLIFSDVQLAIKV